MVLANAADVKTASSGRDEDTSFGCSAGTSCLVSWKAGSLLLGRSLWRVASREGSVACLDVDVSARASTFRPLMSVSSSLRSRAQ